MNMEREARATLSIEDCQRLAAPLRGEIEIFDYEVRRLVVRIGADARRAGASEALFNAASATVLLSIAAENAARAAQHSRVAFDARDFIAGAQSAARWASERSLKMLVGGEA